MKAFYFILLGLMTLGLTAKAQTTDNPLELSGEELKEYLSDPTNKSSYLALLNARVSQSEDAARFGVEVYDLGMVVDETLDDEQGSGSHRASVLDAGGVTNGYFQASLCYNSVDGQNRITRLSEKVYFSPNIVYGSVCLGVLSCHPTVSSLSECPTGPSAPEAAVRGLADESAFVCCPDYCGYGVSANMTHPYLIQDVTARNCLDGYLAAYSFMGTLSVEITTIFNTIFIGYSQGGSVAMACQKLYETMLSDSDKAKIRLTHTYCGDGPYSTLATVNQYIDWLNSDKEEERKLAYPSVLGLITLGAKDAYDKDCMRTVTPEDYFKPEYLERTHALDAIKSKTEDMAAINEVIWNAGIETMDQIMSEEFLIKDPETQKWKLNTSTNVCQCLIRALEKNDVAAGWSPTIPITVFHYRGDMVVPYANLEHIQKQVSEGKWDSSIVKFVDAKDAYEAGYDLNPFLWYAIRSNVDSALAGGWNHLSVGMVFYCWLMFGGVR